MWDAGPDTPWRAGVLLVPAAAAPPSLGACDVADRCRVPSAECRVRLLRTSPTLSPFSDGSLLDLWITRLDRTAPAGGLQPPLLSFRREAVCDGGSGQVRIVARTKLQLTARWQWEHGGKVSPTLSAISFRPEQSLR